MKLVTLLTQEVWHFVRNIENSPGSQFDSKGALHEWYKPKAKEELQRLIKCFIKQYEGIKVTNWK